MTTPYVPSPVKLVELGLPQDAIDQVVVATVNPNSQALADGVQYVYGIQECVGRYTIVTHAGYNVGNNWELDPIEEGPGLEYDAGSKWIEVSEPGNYLVTVQCMIQCIDDTDPTLVMLQAIGVNGFAPTQTMCAPQALRWNDVPLRPFPINGAGVGVLTTAGYKIALRAMSPPATLYNVYDDLYNRLTVHRIS